MASTSASKVNVLIVKPASAIRPKAPTKLTGIVTKGMKDARRVRKKTKTTKATSTTASSTVRKTALIERSMNTALSLAMCTVTDAGMSRCSCGTKARTPAEISKGLAVALRTTPVAMLGRPFNMARERSLAAASSTRATSLKRTVKLPTVLTAMLANCATVLRSVRLVTLNSRCWLSMRPAGTSRFCLRSASSTSCTVRRYDANLSASSHTRMA